MLPQELCALADQIKGRKCEFQNVELKAAHMGNPKKLYDTFSSFSNQTNGGVIVFGIDEKSGYKTVGVYDAQDLQVQVKNAEGDDGQETERRTIVSAEIAECAPEEKPCFYKPAGRIRGSYVRVGESDEPMTEYEVYSYEVYKKKIRDELRTVDRATLDDINRDLLTSYFAKLRLEKQQLAKQDDRKIMQLQGIISGDVPTVCGMMLLGDYPQAFFPQMSVTAMVVNGTEIGETGDAGERFVDSKRLEGTIPQMLEETLSFVHRNMKNAVVVDENGKRADIPEYPMIAVREIILNALVHRDYSIHTEDSPIRVILFSDRLEVENPGGLYGRLTIADLGKEPGDTRNPFIAGNLEVMINTENRFSGVPTIYEEMRKAGLKPPVFESKRGRFRVTLYNERIVNGEKEVREDTEETDPKTVKDKIIKFCREPRTKAEISEMLGIETPYYVMTKYISPMIEDGILSMTIPEKPRSKNQKYFTTE